MSGSATRPFGCLCHEAVGFANAGPANLPPSLKPYDPKRAFDAPLRHRGLPRESGACYAVAPALAAAGLPPASSVQLEPRLVEASPRFVRTYHEFIVMRGASNGGQNEGKARKKSAKIELRGLEDSRVRRERHGYSPFPTSAPPIRWTGLRRHRYHWLKRSFARISKRLKAKTDSVRLSCRGRLRRSFVSNCAMPTRSTASAG